MSGSIKGVEDLSVIAVIPARFASTRFPGKPLALLAGKPMIQWVVERVKQVPSFEAVVVATDSTEIYEAVQAFGGEVEMTHAHHPSGTDRVWEVAQKRPDVQYIFNIQGDEPLINPHYLEEAIEFLKFHHEHADIITLKAPIHERQELEEPNVVKIVAAASGQALYFSRSPIPYIRQPEENPRPQQCYFRHVGVYGFQRSSLQRFVNLPVSPLEDLEKLEQLRALEAGMRIYAVTVPEAPLGIDTPGDLLKVQALIEREQIAKSGG